MKNILPDDGELTFTLQLQFVIWLVLLSKEIYNLRMYERFYNGS